MYKIPKPTIKLDDFFDDLLANRQSEAGNFRMGRIKSIKTELIEKEIRYSQLILDEEKNDLHLITPFQKINIPRDTLVLNFFNFSAATPKNKLIEKITNYKLINFIDVDTASTSEIILEQLEGVTLEHLDNYITDEEDLYKHIRYVDKDVMKEAYEDYIVKGFEGIGRDTYDELMLLADSGICPYCFLGSVNTLDHYLPKAKYIDYAITPVNLIPCCNECNKYKSDEIYDSEDKLLINSYFEDVSKLNWLDGEVVEGFPITFKFKINSSLVDSSLKRRLERQFVKLKLGSRYSRAAGRVFRIRVKSIAQDYEHGGLESVKKKLESDKDSAEDLNLNSLEAKVYESLIKSEWFMRKDTIEEVIVNYKIITK